MALKSIFIVRANNGRDYPSLFSRIVFAGLYSFTAINFDNALTGKSITESDYWPAKAIIFISAVLILEFIYRVHLWCASRFGKGGNILKVAFHQFLLGVVFPRILIWLVLTKWLGLTYLSSMEFVEDGNVKSTAMIFEFLMIANTAFFICYTYMFQRLAADSRENTKDILVFHLGSVEKIEVNEVLCIIPANGANVLISEFVNTRKMVSKASLEEIFSTMPKDRFEMRDRGIFKMGTSINIEEELWQYANKYYPGTYPM